MIKIYLTLIHCIRIRNCSIYLIHYYYSSLKFICPIMSYVFWSKIKLHYNVWYMYHCKYYVHSLHKFYQIEIKNILEQPLNYSIFISMKTNRVRMVVYVRLSFRKYHTIVFILYLSFRVFY